LKRKNKELRKKEFFEQHGIPYEDPENSIEAKAHKILEEYKGKGLLDYFHIHQGKGGRAAKYQKNGEPDLSVYLKGGKTIFIELKIEKGRVKPGQEKLKLFREYLGFDYWIIKGIEGFESLINDQVGYLQD
jgi:hypothetical protein